MRPRFLPVLFVLLSARAWAQGSLSLEQNAEAVTEGRAALDAYERADWETAYQRFERAETLAHSPVFVLHMARAKQRLGAWLEARALYERVLQEPLSSATPESWRLAVDAARAERADLGARLPSIVVVLGASSPAGSTVTLDGEPLNRLGDEVPVNPGAHVLALRREDGAETRHAFTAREGRKGLRIELTIPPVAVSDRANGLPPAAPPAPSVTRSGEPHHTVAYVTGSVGLASLLFGTVAGVLAWNELRQIEEGCSGTRCDPRDAGRLQSTRRLATLADLGFAVGAVGLGTSAILLWVVPETRRPAPVSGLVFGTRYQF